MLILPVADRSHVADVRRRALHAAASTSLDEADRGRVALIVTEFATNLIKHVGGGELVVSTFDDADGSGMELMSLDKGGGIDNVNQAMADGFSTAGSAGTGLGAIRRAADVFAMNSRPGVGTAIMARVRGDEKPTPSRFEIGAVCATCPGETVSGDGWAACQFGSRLVLLVADGSGHGTHAHAAAQRAKEIFSGGADKSVEQTAGRIHLALSPTRGAAIAIADIDFDARQVDFVGIGNIGAGLIEPHGLKRMVSHNGTAGHVAPRIRAFQYPFSAPPSVVMYSDGITGRWNLADYPGLAGAHPSLIAGVLYRDFRRGRDDASVIAVRTRAL